MLDKLNLEDCIDLDRRSSSRIHFRDSFSRTPQVLVQDQGEFTKAHYEHSVHLGSFTLDKLNLEDTY